MRTALLALWILLVASACGEDDGGLPPVDDAGATDDASVAVDAWTSPMCASYATNVEPLYQRHCASCHTTGRDPHFGSSISIARQTTSACRTSMASCTIQLGQRGGSMAYRDPYGGFTAAEVAVIQSWIDCGMPN